MQNYQIFQGLKVLELAGVLAGPAVGQFFAELGADVVKVENVRGGDVTRSWMSSKESKDNRFSAYFASVNWGKRSMICDLRQETSRNTVLNLATKADIILTSFRPGEAAQLGLDYDTIAAIHPKCIYGSITGYPFDALRLGYDAVIQAETGFMYLNRTEGGSPQKMPVALVDLLAAHQLKEGLLLALIQKMQTGKGSHVQASLYEAALASLANQASHYLMTGIEPEPMGSAHPNIAPYGTIYKTRDSREILLAVGNDRQFEDLCKVLDITLYQNDRYARNEDRVKNRLSLEAILKEAIRGMESALLLKSLEKVGVPSGLIGTVGEALNNPLASASLHRSLFATGIRQSIFSWNKERGKSLPPPPDLGEDTVQVLCDWLGFLPESAENWKAQQRLGR